MPTKQPPGTEKPYLQPGVSLLCKIGSICGHVEEGMSEAGHAFDWSTTMDLLADPEVQEWMVAMRKVSLIPEPRNKPAVPPPKRQPGPDPIPVKRGAGHIVKTEPEKRSKNIITKRVRASD